MRRCAAAAVLVLFLFLGAQIAAADPGFVLTESSAKAGDAVHFSLSGVEGDASFVLEIGDRELAEGSDLPDERVSGVFTMPDLGGASKTVTVEAQITQGDETVTLTHTLQYLVPVSAADPARPPLVDSAPASVTQPTAPAEAVPRSRIQERRASRRPKGKRRALRPPARSRETPSAGRRGADRDGRRSRRHRSPVAMASTEAVGPSKPSSEKDAGSSSPSGIRSPGTHVPDSESQLTSAPRTPAIFSLASAVTVGDGGGSSLVAVSILALLCLAAFALARIRPVDEPRPGRVNAGEADDDEILRGVLHSSRGPS